MGQYQLVVNLTKKEFLHPHRMGDGLKLMEFGNSCGGTMTALAILLAVSNGRGGGDIYSTSEIIGSWGGDRIVIIGDYGDVSDLPEADGADTLYRRCSDGEFRDISADLRSIIESDGMFKFVVTQESVTSDDENGVPTNRTFERVNRVDATEAAPAATILRPDMVIVSKLR